MVKYNPFYLMDIWYGEHSIDMYGNQLEVGDIDGDGMDEIIVSAPTASIIKGEQSVNPKELISTGKVTVLKGKDRKVLYEWSGKDHYAHFGYALALGDVNGDGVLEMIISSPFEGNEEAIECGAVRVFSGITGKLLYTVFGSESYQRLGYTLATGDVNGDGFDDIIASSALFDEEGRKGTGKVEVYSGIDGVLLHSFTVPEKEQFGYALAIADIDNDGFQDIVIGAPEASAEEKYRCGKVYVYSGRDYQLLYQFEGVKSRDCIGNSLGAADINGDYHADIIIGSSLAGTNGFTRNGHITAYCGDTGNFLFGVHGDYNHLALGKKIILHDIDNDGIKEIIVGTSGSYVMILDGTNKEIKKIHGETNVFFSTSLAAGDINGDQYAELLVGSSATLHEGELKGAIYLFSSDPNPGQRGAFIHPEKRKKTGFY